MLHQEGTFFGHDRLELYYQCWLPHDNPIASLVIVHGLGEHSGRYLNLVNELVAHGYAVYAFDNRGHGRSPGQRGFVRRFAQFRGDLESFVQQMDKPEQLIRPLFLMGHSLGGLIAADSVLDGLAGFRGVVLSAPALDSGAISRWLMIASKILSRIWPSLSVKTGLDVSRLSRDPAALAKRKQDPLIHGLGTPRLATESSRAMERCARNVHQLQTPILILHGTADRITSPQRSREWFQQLTVSDKAYIAYEGGFHESHNDVHKDQVVTDVRKWLDAHLATPP